MFNTQTHTHTHTITLHHWNRIQGGRQFVISKAKKKRNKYFPKEIIFHASGRDASLFCFGYYEIIRAMHDLQVTIR